MSSTPRHGRVIKVARDNKGLPKKGTVGVCIWLGKVRGVKRVGIKVGKELFWGPASCVINLPV